MDNRNKIYFWGIEGSRCVRLTTSQPPVTEIASLYSLPLLFVEEILNYIPS
jgi:hypothetical protein